MPRIKEIQHSNSDTPGDRIAGVLEKIAQLLSGVHEHRTAADERDAHQIAIRARGVHHLLEDWALVGSRVRRCPSRRSWLKY